MFSCIEETGTGANSSIPENAVEFLAVDMGAMEMTNKQMNIRFLFV